MANLLVGRPSGRGGCWGKRGAGAGAAAGLGGGGGRRGAEGQVEVDRRARAAPAAEAEPADERAGRAVLPARGGHEPVDAVSAGVVEDLAGDRVAEPAGPQ